MEVHKTDDIFVKLKKEKLQYFFEFMALNLGFIAQKSFYMPLIFIFFVYLFVFLAFDFYLF